MFQKRVICVHEKNYGHKPPIPSSVRPQYETNIQKHTEYERKEERKKREKRSRDIRRKIRLGRTSRKGEERKYKGNKSMQKRNGRKLRKKTEEKQQNIKNKL